jgi:hypothetical protein
MSNALAQQQPTALAGLDSKTLESLMSGGDCSKLNQDQRNAYYLARCEAAGLDPRASPFQFVRLSGREVLYATKGAADQLAAKHGLRTTITSQSTEDGIRVVTVRVEAKDGRVTEEIGALPVKGLQGEALSNALMKCVTKAKRRAVLSVCGLGMMDETEVESIPGAQPVTVEPAPRPVVVQVVNPPPAAPAKPPPSMPTTAKDLKDRWAEHCNAHGIDNPTKIAKFFEAMQVALGDTPPPSEKWNAEQVELVARILLPDLNADVPF